MLLYRLKKLELSNKNKSEASNTNLFDLLKEKLPLDVLHYINSYCEINDKIKIRQDIQKHPIYIIITSIILYFIGYTITKRFLGIFIILNFLIGYLILCLFSLILILIGLFFKACITF